MDKYQYKEKDYAKDILEKGFITNYYARELRVLVKHFKEQGHPPKARKELIEKFCEENLSDYDKVTHFKMVNSVLNHGANRKNVLVQIDSITIYEEEMKYISSLGLDTNHAKLVFSLMCLNKLSFELRTILGVEGENIENYFGSPRDYKFLASTSKISLKNQKQIHRIIREIAELGIVEIAIKGKIKLSFIDELPVGDNEAIELHTFDNIGLYFDEYFNIKKIKRCENCGTPIVIKSNNKYCAPCQKDIRRDYMRDMNRKSRINKKR